MELDYAILADGAQQRADGKLDIFGAGFDTILAPSVPALHPHLALVLRFMLAPEEPAEHRVEISIEDPARILIAGGEGRITVDTVARDELAPGQTVGIATVLNFESLVLRAYGEHRLSVRWGDERERVVRFFIKPPPGAP